MSTPIEQLAGAVGHWEHSPHPSDHFDLVFGADSFLCRAMEYVIADGGSDAVQTLTAKMLAESNREQMLRLLQVDSDYPVDAGMHVLSALNIALKMVGSFTDTWDGQAIAECIAHFDQAWGDPAPRAGVGDATHAEDLLWSAFAGTGKAETTAGYWIAWGLLDRLRAGARGEQPRDPVTGEATLPVLLFNDVAKTGHVLWLQVQLFESRASDAQPGGFDPDPLALGLTAIRNANGDDPGHYLDSLRHVWSLSGLGDTSEVGHAYRGRWRITSSCPLPDPRWNRHIERYYPRIDGHSTEAAALAALWSAAGWVPYQSPYRRQLGDLPLSPDVAISASLLELKSPRAAIHLGSVGGVGWKLDAAKEYPLRLVLLADDETDLERETRHDEIRGAVEHYGDLLVERVETAGVALHRMLVENQYSRAFKVRSYNAWQSQWRPGTADFETPQNNDESPEAGELNSPNNPTYIADQAWSLLTEFAEPKRLLQSQWFRPRRQGGSETTEDLAWAPIDNHVDVALNHVDLPQIGHVDLLRTAVTTDSGMGKSAAMEWAAARINFEDDGRIAIPILVSDLAQLSDAEKPITQRLLEELSRRWIEATADPLRRLDSAEAMQMLDHLRQRGDLVLVFDGLDQGDAGVANLQAILDSPSWEHCRIFVAGRPHALLAHWDVLFHGRPWRFLRTEEFNAEQRDAYLQKADEPFSRYKVLIQKAGDLDDILGVPRVLYYLREMDQDEFAKIQRASHVYYFAIKRMIEKGRSDPIAKSLSFDGAFELLAAIAFEVTFWRESDSSTLNFDPIERGEWRRFRRRLLACSAKTRSVSEQEFDENLKALAALNVVLESAFFDAESESFQSVAFRNRSLQEFLCAYYFSQLASGDDFARLAKWIYLKHRPESEVAYHIWQFLCEMHEDARDSKYWLPAIKPLYHPARLLNCNVESKDVSASTEPGQKGDRWVADRSTEMIFRSWPTLKTYCDAKIPSAVEIRCDFQEEFEKQILAGHRGSGLQTIAQEFVDSFLELPPGSFQMGSRREKWEAFRDDDRELITKFIRQYAEGDQDGREAMVERFTVHIRNRQERQQLQAWWHEQLDRGDPQFLMDQMQYDEEPESLKQQIGAFQLSRFPCLNAWYRLFDPDHGLRKDPTGYQGYSDSPRKPAIYIDWFDAWVFCRWARWDDLPCRLPWENEWEYGAKFGADDSNWHWNYWWGDAMDGEKCNAEGRVGATTEPTRNHANEATIRLDVAREEGLCDMLGNVAEWCQDIYQPRYRRDESVASNGSPFGFRSLRGGSFNYNAQFGRSACRNRFHPTITD